MKKLSSIIIIITLLVWFVWLNGQKNSTPVKSPISDSPSPTKVKTIEDDGHEVAYNLFIASPEQVELFSNLKFSTDSATAKTVHNCRSLINAGFYTKENTHLGLFISNNEIIHPAIESTLVDGFLSIHENNIPTISFDEPTDAPPIAVQSGPIIWKNNARRPLRLIEDKFARRSIAGVTLDGRVVFITVYFNDQEYSGPLLSRTPYILEKIQLAEKLRISDAINLDGGSASAFISEGTTLNEISPIGGFFCIM